jgi:hypothetical protein
MLKSTFSNSCLRLTGLGVTTIVCAAVLCAAIVPFSSIIIDPVQIPNGHKPKVIGDFAGNGLAGLGALSAGRGFVLYQYPNWTPYVISSFGDGVADEDAQVADVNRDGALDIIVGGQHGNTYWLENPLKQGRNPYTSPWRAHQIGLGRPSHDVIVGDINRDGKIDVATESGIYLQGATADSWTFVGIPNINRDYQGTSLASLSNDGYLDVIAPYQNGTRFAWFENPLHHGGDPTKGVWTVHIIDANPGFAGYMTSAVTDVNRDGRVDILMCPMYADGNLVWYESTSANGSTWTKHVIGPVSYVHQGSLQLQDFNGDGQLDIAFAEQEQSTAKRVGVFFNQGSGSGWTLQVLSTSGGHNIKAGVVGNNPSPGIWNANHGYFGAHNPLELYEIGGSGSKAVSAPTISPNGGTISGSVTVTLASDSGATIHYTTDGSVPTTASRVYGAPFQLTSAATVNAYAVKSGLADSAVSSAVFTLASQGGSVPGSVLKNGGFDEGTGGWTFFTSGTGSFTTVPGFSGLAANIQISTAGANVQFYQSGIILEPNTRYRLTFVGRCATGHTVQVSVLKHTSPYTNYGLEPTTFALGTSWQTYSTVFTTSGFSSTVGDARLMFWMSAAKAGDQIGFDEVTISKL